MAPYEHGDAHVLLETGELMISAPAGLLVELEGIPLTLGASFGEPRDYIDLARIALGNDDGYEPTVALEHARTLLWPVPTGMTLAGLTLTPGVQATVTELVLGLNTWADVLAAGLSWGDIKALGIRWKDLAAG